MHEWPSGGSFPSRAGSCKRPAPRKRNAPSGWSIRHCAGVQFRGSLRLYAQHIDTCNVIGYAPRMIQSFKHKGLELFFKTGRKSGIQAKHSKRLQLILGRLNAAVSPDDMNLPGLYLHKLSGSRATTWAVRVSGNWRVTFQFKSAHAEVVDYEDYH